MAPPAALLGSVETMASPARAYSVVLFGATGFTGQLCANYLSEDHVRRTGVKWAVAGRTQAKLDQVVRECGGNVPSIVASSHDYESLLSMCRQTKVVISTVGPYMLYGESLVKACCETGTHYVDLTGEAPFIAQMIKLYGRGALESKALLVMSTGFDSTPSDLTTYLAVQRLKKVPGAVVGNVKAVFTLKGGASGGTIASALNFFNNGTKEEFAVAQDPFCLSPVKGNHRPGNVFVTSSSFRGKTAWGAFFFMAPHNCAIVRRSWGILQAAGSPSNLLGYGDKFQYEEMLATGGPISAAITSSFLYFSFISLALIKPLRWLLGYLIPAGTGPSVESQKSGFFKCATTASSTDGKNQVCVTMKGNIDPGYSGTARMIVESALCISENYATLPSLARQGGFLTPATAFGETLRDRLEATGTFSFLIESDKKE